MPRSPEPGGERRQRHPLRPGVRRALFEPDWVDIDKDLTSYVEDWKTATGS
ncbi:MULTISPECIES: hypothetical protein [Streptomyces]|uniref:hypothetical protein n=1 Tax=Streptomyces TaxID=1883 RepID=UPI00167CC6BB|nr:MULTISPECIES: hypothetical protein [Streptomyces]